MIQFSKKLLGAMIAVSLGAVSVNTFAAELTLDNISEALESAAQDIEAAISDVLTADSVAESNAVEATSKPEGTAPGALDMRFL